MLVWQCNDVSLTQDLGGFYLILVLHSPSLFPVSTVRLTPFVWPGTEIGLCGENYCKICMQSCSQTLKVLNHNACVLFMTYCINI